MYKWALMMLIISSSAHSGVMLKSFQVEQSTPKTTKAKAIVPRATHATIAPSVVAITITRRNGGNVTIEQGMVNSLSIGNKQVFLDYTPDEIFKNGFER